MPAVTKGKVLVTGANGYIALWVVQSLLDAGYSVRGTVRRESAIAHLKECFKSYGDKLEVVVVPDITKEGAFDEAVKGVDAIEHTASPFHFNVTDPQELIAPAVAGTGSVLQSAFKYANDTVKRVVITSSTAAVVSPAPDNKPYVLDERSWNEHSIKEVETKGKDAAKNDMYRASKTLAERAAWQFIENHKGEVKFDLVVLNPPFVYGPVQHEVDKPENLNTSMLDWYNTVIKGTRTNEELVNISSSWVDVRDLGLAHTLALQKEEAGGERIIISAGPWKWQDFVSAAHTFDSSLPAGNTTYKPENAIYTLRYDASKSQRVLGIKYRSLEESTKDMVEQFKSRGWY